MSYTMLRPCSGREDKVTAAKRFRVLIVEGFESGSLVKFVLDGIIQETHLGNCWRIWIWLLGEICAWWNNTGNSSGNTSEPVLFTIFSIFMHYIRFGDYEYL